MLRNSFIFIPGVGELTERELWESGITTWEKLENSESSIHSNRHSGKELYQHISAAKDALDDGDASYFANRMPNSELWRLYPEFQDETVFLDIESTGLSEVYNETTVITTYANDSLRFFIKGGNLSEFVDYISDFDLLVTYNGKWFDIPFLREDLDGFGMEHEPPVHLDLRPLARTVGLTGGLKAVENALGISRPDTITNFDGKDATRLWCEFLYGEDDSIKKLIEYNISDTINLVDVLHNVIQQKVEDITSYSSPQKRLAVDGGSQLIRDSPTIAEFAIDRIDSRPPASRSRNVQLRKEGEDEFSIIYEDRNIVIDRTEAKGDEIDIHSILGRLDTQPRSIGIDLSGSEDSATGVCILSGAEAVVETVHRDEEIHQLISDNDPDIVSIDSPLSLPEGRCCTAPNCECEEHGIIRECEQELKRRGVNTYPCLIDSMRGLTERGINLANSLEEEGLDVIESYPGAAQDVMGVPRKGVGIEVLERGLNNIGLQVSNKDAGDINHDELDAITSALVSHFYLADVHEVVGTESNGIVVPDIAKIIGN